MQDSSRSNDPSRLSHASKSQQINDGFPNMGGLPQMACCMRRSLFSPPSMLRAPRGYVRSIQTPQARVCVPRSPASSLFGRDWAAATKWDGLPGGTVLGPSAAHVLRVLVARLDAVPCITVIISVRSHESNAPCLNSVKSVRVRSTFRRRSFLPAIDFQGMPGHLIGPIHPTHYR